MKQFLILIITASVLFLGAVNAEPTNNQVTKYGPVKAGQTLWGIAYKTRPKGISRLHMMRAIHRLNPDAFEKGNINLLKKGALLNLPTSKKMVEQLLSGKEVQVTIEEGDDSNKDLETLRNELARVKEELAQSKETLKGLREQSEKLQQAQQTITSLKKENEELKSAASQSSEESEKLATISKELKQAQARIKTLEEEKVALEKKANATPEVPEDHKKTLKALASVTQELAKSQQLVKTLAEKNKQLQEQSIDPELFKNTKEELAATREQLEAIKVQNQLLREQTANADVSEQERKQSNQKFTDTIAALNADISQLRSRIKELEELEKMKDNHIAELQKSLDHATAVIKEQAEVNKKMYARLNAMEKADKEKEQQSEQEDENQAATAVSNSNPSDPSPPGGKSVDSANIVNFADKAGMNNSTSAVSQSLKSVSPKFWLMLTLAGLLFVLALLWRLIAGKDDTEALT